MSVPLLRLEPGELDGPSDAHLIAAVRAGDGDAFGHLYRRHVAAAHNLARQLTRSTAERDDLVAEAFAKVLDTMRAGGGPDIAFRAYLLTTLRNTLYDRVRRDRRLELSDDMTRHDPGEPWVDTAVADFESTMAARAFARLPERWQTVLWHTEVEQETPAQVAPVLGLSANGVAALAYRAREGLRQAYLQEHLADADGKECRHTVERLGAWARGGLSRRSRVQVDRHLESCAQCRLLARELADVNSSLRGLIAPAVLGGGALVTAYLAAAAPEAAGAAGAAGGAAGAAGAGAGAAGAGVAAGAGSGGSLLGTAAGWVIGTQVGQVGAAAVAAVVIGGTAVVGISTGPADDSRALGSATSATASPGLSGPDGSIPGAAGPAGAPGAAGSPGSPGAPGARDRSTAPAASGRGSGGDPSVSGGPGSSGGPSGSGGPGSSGPPSGVPGAPGGLDGVPGQPGAVPGQPGGARTAPPALQVGTPAPAGLLRRGQPGEVGIPVRNTGTARATELTAVVSLPAGLTVRASGSDDPDEWKCTGNGPVATCRVTELPAGGTGTVLVRVDVAPTARSGEVSGRITAAGGPPKSIPTALVPVEAA